MIAACLNPQPCRISCSGFVTGLCIWCGADHLAILDSRGCEHGRRAKSRGNRVFILHELRNCSRSVICLDLPQALSNVVRLLCGPCMIAKLLEARLASGLAQEQGCEMKARCCDTSPFVDCRNGLCIYFQCVKRLHSVTLCQRYGLTARPAFSPCLPRNRYVTMNSNLVWLPSINDQASIVLCQTEGQLTASNGILSDLSDLVEMSKRNALLLGAKPVQMTG